MSVWSIAGATILASAAVAAGHQAVQVVQSPAPAVTVVAQAEPEVRQEENEQRVSADFKHAAVSDVLDWLSKNGINFATADSELPKDATITLSAKDMPLSQVLDSIASALGGHWERRGDMRVFRKGEGFTVFANGSPFGDGEKSFNIAPFAKGFSKDQIKAFGKDGKTFVMPVLPKGQWMSPDMPDLKELKDLKELPEINAETQKQVEEAMKAAQKAMEENGDSMKISQKAMEEARKAIEKARKEHPEAFNGRIFISPDEKGFYRVAPNSKDKVFQYRVGRPSIAIDGRSFTKFMDSLSPDQKETNRRQGYLRASDLTESQRKMLGIEGREKGWTIKINKDGEEVTIKSDN